MKERLMMDILRSKCHLFFLELLLQFVPSCWYFDYLIIFMNVLKFFLTNLFPCRFDYHFIFTIHIIKFLNLQTDFSKIREQLINLLKYCTLNCWVILPKLNYEPAKYKFYITFQRTDRVQLHHSKVEAIIQR